MLNYIAAELWRITRRRQALVLCGSYLALVALTGLFWSGGNLAQALEALHGFLVVGLYLCFPLAALADGDLGRAGLLRNETSFGLPRGRIYLGKLLSALIVGLVLFLLTAVVFLSAAYPMAAGLPVGEDALAFAWRRLGTGVMTALPLYVGALSLAHLLCFTLHSNGLGAVLYYVYLVLGELFLGAAHLYGLGLFGALFNAGLRAVRPFLLSGPFISYNGVIIRPEMGQCWLTGVVWLGATTALGMAEFHRREIK